VIARCIFATCALASSAAFAASVTCATDPNTDQHMCVNDKGVRASSDKQVREAALYGGGPNSVKATGHTARVFCSDKFVPVLELRDRNGVVFARNQPEAKIGRDLAGIMCSMSPVRIDKALDKVPRY
jgi:hypothetical protein